MTVFSCLSACLSICWSSSPSVYLEVSPGTFEMSRSPQQGILLNYSSTVSGHDSKLYLNLYFFVLLNVENDGSCLKHGFHSFRSSKMVSSFSVLSPPSSPLVLSPPHSESLANSCNTQNMKLSSQTLSVQPDQLPQEGATC